MKLQILTLMAITLTAASEAIVPRAALPNPAATTTEAAATTTQDALRSSISGVISSATAAASSFLDNPNSICSSLTITGDCNVQITNGKTIVNGKTIGGSTNVAPTPAPMAKAGAAVGLLGVVAGGLLL